MRHRGKLLCWLIALTSMVTMIGVRTFHSPLVHMLGGCSDGQACHAPAAPVSSQPAKSACGHVHHTHVDVAAQSTCTQAACCESEQGDCPTDHSHQHSDDCQLCQFLTQSVTPIYSDVQLIGEEKVSETPVSEVLQVICFSVTGPEIRGPPALI